LFFLEEVIRDLTLAPDVSLTAEERRVVKIQYQKYHPVTSSPDDLEKLLVEYLKFMRIKLCPTRISSSRRLPKLTKCGMRTFCLSSTILLFCERHNGGEYVHHDPVLGNGQYRYKMTLAAYKKFALMSSGENQPPRDIWIPAVNVNIGEAAAAAAVAQSDDEEKDDDDASDGSNGFVCG